MKLQIFYTDKHSEEIEIKRFSDLTTHNSGFYYFEKPEDELGKGSFVKRDSVSCVEVLS